VPPVGILQLIHCLILMVIHTGQSLTQCPVAVYGAADYRNKEATAMQRTWGSLRGGEHG